MVEELTEAPNGYEDLTVEIRTQIGSGVEYKQLIILIEQRAKNENDCEALKNYAAIHML